MGRSLVVVVGLNIYDEVERVRVNKIIRSIYEKTWESHFGLCINDKERMRMSHFIEMLPVWYFITNSIFISKIFITLKLGISKTLR